MKTDRRGRATLKIKGNDPGNPRGYLDGLEGVDMVATGTPEVARASVTISTPYFGWAAVDQAARALAGAPAWESDAMPVGLITLENFADYPAGEPYLNPDFDYPAHFAEMWGK